MINPMSRNYLITLAILIFSTEAYAYIDPGTGSLLIQGLIAGIAAGLYTIKLYWYRIKNFFTRNEEKLDVDTNKDE